LLFLFVFFLFLSASLHRSADSRVDRIDIDELVVVEGSAELKFLSGTRSTPHIIVINIAADYAALLISARRWELTPTPTAIKATRSVRPNENDDAETAVGR